MHEMKHCSNLALGQNCNQVLTPQLLLAENCNFLEKNRFVVNYCMTRSASYMYRGYAHTHHCRPYLQGVINVPFKNIHFSKYFSPIPGVLPFQFCLFIFFTIPSHCLNFFHKAKALGLHKTYKSCHLAKSQNYHSTPLLFNRTDSYKPIFADITVYVTIHFHLIKKPISQFERKQLKTCIKTVHSKVQH